MPKIIFKGRDTVVLRSYEDGRHVAGMSHDEDFIKWATENYGSVVKHEEDVNLVTVIFKYKGVDTRVTGYSYRWKRVGVCGNIKDWI